MSRRFVIHDFDDPDARGPDGLIRDGHGYRIGMQFADSLGRAVARNSPVRRGGGATDADRRSSAPGLVCDAWGNTNSPSLHQPGYRGLSYATDSVGHAELEHQRRLCDAAYAESVRDLTTAWQTDARKGQSDDDGDDDDDPDDDDRDDDDEDEHPRHVRRHGAGDAMPPGAYPANSTLRPGDPCSWNGAPGRLVERDGALVCEVRSPGPSRSSRGSVRAFGTEPIDSVPRTCMTDRDIERCEQIKRDAWEELQAETANAWKAP
jgi:hypothetical protein